MILNDLNDVIRFPIRKRAASSANHSQRGERTDTKMTRSPARFLSKQPGHSWCSVDVPIQKPKIEEFLKTVSQNLRFTSAYGREYIMDSFLFGMWNRCKLLTCLKTACLLH